MLQKDRKSERGVALLLMTSILVFSLAGVMALSVAVSQNTFVMRQSKRILLQRQAHWLAESAVQRARAILATQSETMASGRQDFSLPVAPVFIDPEIVVDTETANTDWPPTVKATYGFDIQPAPDRFAEAVPNSRRRYIIEAHAEIPYRTTHLSETILRLCYQKQDGSWSSIPVVP